MLSSVTYKILGEKTLHFCPPIYQILAKFSKFAFLSPLPLRLQLPFQNHCKQHFKQCLTCVSELLFCQRLQLFTCNVLWPHIKQTHLSPKPIINEVLTFSGQKIRFSPSKYRVACGKVRKSKKSVVRMRDGRCSMESLTRRRGKLAASIFSLTRLSKDDFLTLLFFAFQRKPDGWKKFFAEVEGVGQVLLQGASPPTSLL